MLCVNIYKFKETQEMAEGALDLSPNSYDLQKLQDNIMLLNIRERIPYL